MANVKVSAVWWVPLSKELRTPGATAAVQRIPELIFLASTNLEPYMTSINLQ